MNWDYIAGLIDGEGTIGINETYNRVYIKISNTHKPTLEKVQIFLKNKGIKSTITINNPKIKNLCYNLIIGGNIGAIRVLTAIQDRVYIKRKKVKKAINFLKNTPHRWYGHYPMKQILKAIELIEKGNTIESVSKYLNISEATISYWCKKLKRVREWEKKKFYIEKSKLLNGRVLKTKDIYREFALKPTINKNSWIRKVGIIKHCGFGRWIIQQPKKEISIFRT